MLTFAAQSQLADAMGHMMRSCALAATRTWTDSVLRGLSVWSALMLAPGARAEAGSNAASAARDAAPASFSSYRSGGGHAAAQVIVGREA